MFQRVTGPECPVCACEDSEYLGRKKRLAGEADRRRCNHCGRVWYLPVAENEQDNESHPQAVPGSIPGRTSE